MSIKNTLLGGTNWTNTDVITATDFNDTFNAVVDLILSIERSLPPIGAYFTYNTAYSGSPGTIPNWALEANGQLINDADSPMNGQYIRNLNGNSDATKLFVACDSIAGNTGGATSHGHNWSYQGSQDYGSGGNPNGMTTESNIPLCIDMKWLVRIK